MTARPSSVGGAECAGNAAAGLGFATFGSFDEFSLKNQTWRAVAYSGGRERQDFLA